MKTSKTGKESRGQAVEVRMLNHHTRRHRTRAQSAPPLQKFARCRHSRRRRFAQTITGKGEGVMGCGLGNLLQDSKHTNTHTHTQTHTHTHTHTLTHRHKHTDRQT